jgi:hypothetical protein
VSNLTQVYHATAGCVLIAGLDAHSVLLHVEAAVMLHSQVCIGIMCCRFDLGTADELGLDVLINALTCFSKE